ncbi:MAG: hypothetical protein M1834_001649 [Cirrosporium novae-zelandiae]|nr:MAG: hypothetical protein M1834_004166 [Cirrosporium novae-zelandiae]KAI9735633.1 MAG: hypothetical protein M1834_001649 [Cirrosporium novae-zelandiae]
MKSGRTQSQSKVQDPEKGTLENDLVIQGILSFRPDDPDNPVNWSRNKKAFIVIVGLVAVFNSVLDSSLPSGAIDYIAKDFNITNKVQLVLPISVYLIGYVLGPLLFGPLSETYGRRMIMAGPFALFIIFTLACAVAPNWASFVVFRFICGICASSPIAVTGGLYADIYNNPVTRGRAMALMMAVTTIGPQFAPIISGFVSAVSWRWTFWVGLIIACVSFIPFFFLPETFGPVILQRRARAMRMAGEKNDVYAPIELEKKGPKEMLTIILARPLIMLVFEPIVLFTCLYLSLASAIFFLFFEAYPLVFQGIYGMSIGISGLAFLPIAIGACVGFAIFLYYDSVLRDAKNRNAHWSSTEEYRRLPLACLGGPAYVISLFWLGWTSSPGIHWIVPMLAGVPFGIGFFLIFVALLNYLADAYKEFAASAMAAASCSRSIFGAVLPLAATPMYNALGIGWGNSLLAFLSLGMSLGSFVFLKYGDRVRANSKFCQELAQRSGN